MKIFDVFRNAYSRRLPPEWLGWMKAETANEARDRAQAEADRRSDENDEDRFSVEVEEAEGDYDDQPNDEYA